MMWVATLPETLFFILSRNVLTSCTFVTLAPKALNWLPLSLIVALDVTSEFCCRPDMICCVGGERASSHPSRTVDEGPHSVCFRQGRYQSLVLL